MQFFRGVAFGFQIQAATFFCSVACLPALATSRLKGDDHFDATTIALPIEPPVADTRHVFDLRKAGVNRLKFFSNPLHG